MARYKNDPRIITARFDSKCAETGKPIHKGEACLYFPSSKQVFCLESKEAADWRSRQFDEREHEALCEYYGVY